MNEDGRFLLIYGSVTGNAESIAEQIANEAEKRGFQVDLQCMKGVGKKVNYNFKYFYYSVKSLSHVRVKKLL